MINLNVHPRMTPTNETSKRPGIMLKDEIQEVEKEKLRRRCWGQCTTAGNPPAAGEAPNNVNACASDADIHSFTKMRVRGCEAISIGYART